MWRIVLPLLYLQVDPVLAAGDSLQVRCLDAVAEINAASRGLLALGGGAGGALVLAQDRLALLRGLLQELRPGTCGP